MPNILGIEWSTSSARGAAAEIRQAISPATFSRRADDDSGAITGVDSVFPPLRIGRRPQPRC